ncbi:hypothetical protein DRN97_04620 [Methanosarcinales archaeon]|nr:MAG: hypothetical protein DRN97_04620 [Methanosarcinales archaeon]
MLCTFAQIAFGNFFYPQNVIRNRIRDENKDKISQEVKKMIKTKLFREGQDMDEKNLRIYGVCGIISTLLITAANIVGALLRPGYSSVTQAISELIEAGAPNKILLDTMLFGFPCLSDPVFLWAA